MRREFQARNRFPKGSEFEIEHELEQLPTYGVFDFIAFGYDRGKVTLEGYTYQGGLKSHARTCGETCVGGR